MTTEDYELMKSLLVPQTDALQALAMRPQKKSTITNTMSTTTPYALADMVANRNRIGQATRNLNDALRARESLGYTLANSLANIPQQQGYGSWLTDFARSLGGAWGMPTNMAADRAQKQYENEMKDLATILAYDKAMGDTQNQYQSQAIEYQEMPYGVSGGKGKNEQIEEVEPYDISKPEMPENPIRWSDVDVQGQKVDPATGLPTVGGLVSKYIGAGLEEKGRFSKNANQNAYTKTFTVPSITKISKAAGGSRGIDTMPEVNIKGGPELSSANMNSTDFENAVKDQAWDISDQIIKANPKATITRAELADAIINNFNHRIRPEFRIVSGFDTGKKVQQPVISMPTVNSSNGYDYSKYEYED